jgi:hypothetical protein
MPTHHLDFFRPCAAGEVATIGRSIELLAYVRRLGWCVGERDGAIENNTRLRSLCRG